MFDYAVSRSAGGLSPRVKWEQLSDYEIELLNKLIENCIYYGIGGGGPYYTNINNTEFAIENFLKAIDPTLGVKYIDQEIFFVYRKGACE